MKVLAFALLLLVAVTYGEALQCNNCVCEAPDSGDCVETVDACPPEMDACAKITYPAPHENTFHKSCFKMVECLNLGLTRSEGQLLQLGRLQQMSLHPDYEMHYVTQFKAQ